MRRAGRTLFAGQPSLFQAGQQCHQGPKLQDSGKYLPIGVQSSQAIRTDKRSKERKMEAKKRRPGVIGFALISALFLVVLLASSRNTQATKSPDNGGYDIPFFTPSPTIIPTPTNTPACGLTWRGFPHAGTNANALIRGMEAVSANNVWAVGEGYVGSYRGYVERWDGQTWNEVPLQAPGGDYSRLFGLDVVSDDDIWAVGHIGWIFGNLALATLTEHWDGTSWTHVESPNVGDRYNDLYGVAAVSSNDVWAVGTSYILSEMTDHTMILHWDGNTWSVVPSPNIGDGDNLLTAVTAVSTNDVWAVGYYRDYVRGGYSTLVLHWDGASWTIVPSPNPDQYWNYVFAVKAIGPNDVWAAGNTGVQPLRSLLLHWDGAVWSSVSNPGYFTVRGLSALSSSSMWAVGDGPNALRWNGSQWTLYGTLGNYQLNGVAAISPLEAWAAGNVMERFNDPCATSTNTPTPTLTVTGTPPTATNTPTPTNTRTATTTPPTSTPTRTRTPTSTSPPSFTPTFTPSRTNTVSGTPPTATSTSQVPTPTPTSGLGCYADAIVGASSCSDPQNGIYRYDITLRGYCGQCEVQSVGLYYTATLLVAPDMGGPFTPYYQGPTRERDLRCQTIEATEAITIGAIPPPNTVYKIGVEYSSTAGNHDWSYSSPQPICSQITVTPTSTAPTVTPTPTLTPMACQSWTEKASYPTAAFSLMATSVGGDVYAFGGRDANYVRLTSAYKYRPLNNDWIQLASMPQICFWCSAVAVNGNIYIVNGSHDNGPANDSSIYNPVTNSWSAGGSGLIGTYGQSAVYMGNVLYRIGGIDEGGYTNTVEDYGHTLLAPLPQGVAWAQAIAMPPYIYVAGGSTDGGIVNKTYRYDPGTNSWDDNAIADLPEPRAWAASGVVGGKWVIVGGVGTEGSAVSWDPQTNTWSHIAPPLYPRSDMGGAAVSGANLYLVAGLTDTDTQVSARVEEYDPAACSPATGTPTPTGTITTTATATVTTTTTTTTTTTDTATALPTSCPIQFADVPGGSTFYPYIRCLACRGIVSGYADGTFRPYNNVTRGQLSKIVSVVPFPDPYTQTFEDVPPGSTFYRFVETLAEHGNINGYACGGPGEPCVPPGNRPYFRTNNNATRGQIAKIDSNVAGFNDLPVGQFFEDLLPGSTFYTYTQRLASRSIMQGYECGGAPGEPCIPPFRPYFRPNNNATRGQTSKIVANTFFPDCQTPSR
jgi:hypothetical protein